MIDEKEFKKLKAEVDRLNAEVVALKTFVRDESNDVTKHTGRLYDEIGELHEYLWPIIHKVLPDFKYDRKRIEEIFSKKKRPD